MPPYLSYQPSLLRLTLSQALKGLPTKMANAAMPPIGNPAKVMVSCSALPLFASAFRNFKRPKEREGGGDDLPLNECWWSHAFLSSGTPMRRLRRRDRSLDAFSNANLVTIAGSFSVAHLTGGACSFFATTVLDRAIERWQRQRQRMGGYGVYLVHCHPIKPALDRKAFPIDFIPCRRSDGVGPSGFLHLAIIAILALLFDLFLARDL